MKKLLAISAFMFALGSANASETKQFDSNSLQLLNAVFANCPIQFVQAMKGANRVGKATYTSDRPGETYIITTFAGGYAPSFDSYPVSTLKITRTVVRDGGPIAADRPTQWNVSCQLTSHDQE